jgi:hypothetical protein
LLLLLLLLLLEGENEEKPKALFLNGQVMVMFKFNFSNYIYNRCLPARDSKDVSCVKESWESKCFLLKHMSTE